MFQDILSNYSVADDLASASQAIGAVNGNAIDHTGYPSAYVHISVTDVGTGGTLDGKLQYSLDGGSTWVDAPDTDAGHTTTITQITAAGESYVNIPQPRGATSRVVFTVATDAVVFNTVVVKGPALHVAA